MSMETMGCGTSKTVSPVESTTLRKDSMKTPNERQSSPVAFEISLEEVTNGGGNDVKKPPRRLERLANAGPQNTNITSEDVEEKLRKAEERRQEIIEERIKNSRLLAEKMRKTATDAETNDG